MRLTEETAKEIYMLFYKMCADTKKCDNCVAWSHKSNKCELNHSIIRDSLDYILACQEPTNEEKFKETFGFPLYELHQLSAEEEREWSEKIYQKNNTQMD